ncbi:MAG TPA: hypothetical protein VGL19_00770 [Polyangiaceae bacterium]
MPLAVKLLAGGLGLLIAVYGLTLLRDRKDSDGARAPSGPDSQAALIAPHTELPNAGLVPASPVAMEAAVPSSPLAAASPSASTSTAMMPMVATRVKSVMAAIQAHKPLNAQLAASAGQPNVAAALVPPAAPAAAPAPVAPSERQQ